MPTHQTFASYILVDKIADGAFAQIFKVKKGDGLFALKKLKPPLKFDWEFQALLKTEAFLLSKVKDSSHFPVLYEHGTFNEEHYLILELIEGLNLEQIIKKRSSEILPPPLACLIASELCLGLEHLHSLELFSERPTVHGDLRPSNVILSKKGEVKIVDLGLKGGTFNYMPLERLHDRKLTFYTDIYATGHILYEILHGRSLFKGETKMESYFEMREKIINEKSFDEKIPSAVKQILFRCLNQDPDTRYKTISELGKNLNEYLIDINFIPDRRKLADLTIRLTNP